MGSSFLARWRCLKGSSAWGLREKAQRDCSNGNEARRPLVFLVVVAVAAAVAVAVAAAVAVAVAVVVVAAVFVVVLVAAVVCSPKGCSNSRERSTDLGLEAYDGATDAMMPMPVAMVMNTILQLIITTIKLVVTIISASKLASTLAPQS